MLQFVLGDLTQDHFQWCIADAHQQLVNNDGVEIYTLVPDHMKFDAEKAMFRGLKAQQQHNESIYGNLNVNVYSFTRLSWVFLKDTGILSKPHLSRLGQEMVVRYVLLTHEKDLKHYKLEARKQGFITRLSELFQQFRRGNVDTDLLEQFVKSYQPKDISQEALLNKMRELTLLYHAYTKHITHQFLDTEQLYEQLVNYIQATDLSKTVVYIHGYERFNAMELKVVHALIRACQKVVVTLPLPKHKIKQTRFDALGYIPQQTYQQLLHFATSEKMPVAFDVDLTHTTRNYSKGMQALLTFWEDTYSNKSVSLEKMPNDDLMLHTFATKYEEVEAVAKLISYYVHEKGYRYNDFYVLMRQVEDYETLLEPIFKESRIPLFFDNASAMSLHPLIECIASLYDIEKRYYQYNDVMRFLKTYLPPFATSDAVDLLENELLANGYSGGWWFKADEWENEAIRQAFLKCVVPFFEQLKSAQTMKEAASLLYQFLLELKVPQTLLKWRDDFIALGELERGKKQEQAWTTFVQLLDEFVLVLGDVSFDKEMFYRVLITGFEQSEFNLVPASLDQVNVASVDGKRLSPKKMVFVIGAQPTQFPKMYDQQSLLSQDDIGALQPYFSQDTYLDLSSNYRTRVEPFVAMNVWVSALEKVFIFATASSSQSAYMHLLANHFDTPTIDFNQLIGVGKMAVRQIVRSLNVEASPLDTNVSKKVIQGIEQSPKLAKWFAFLKTSLQYTNQPKPLINAQQLYQGQLHLSISQLESYFGDPFSHFLKYGLKLKERATLELSAANIGNVFHAVLDGIHQNILKENKQLRNLTLDDVVHLTQQELNRTFDLPQNQVFNRTKSMQFSKRLIEETLQQTIMELYRQNQMTSLNTIATEMRFGTQAQAGMLSVPPIPIDSKTAVHLRGIIDRLDANDHYYSVVDYKSSDRQFKLEQFYEGVSLQLMTYLYVANAYFAKDKHPIGAFYREVNFEYQMAQQVDEERLMMKQKGLIVSPSQVLKELDDNQAIYHARLTTKGEYVKNQPFIFETTQLPLLFNYLMAKIKEAGHRILSGDISLYPIENSPYIPSLNEYRSISLFDATQSTNRYRRFEKPNTYDDILMKIQQKVGEVHD
ncbi:PD-(D/E)XK nuclease family protein [Carnobacteriaceae bacterium zg-C25]|nr:PD-(D/E)XK nuclease family protein [Carnobacteriaceae bacterium zg-C25]